MFIKIYAIIIIYSEYFPIDNDKLKCFTKPREYIGSQRVKFDNERDYSSSLHLCATGLFKNSKTNELSVAEFFLPNQNRRLLLEFKKYNRLDLFETALIPAVTISPCENGHFQNSKSSQMLYIFSDTEESYGTYRI